MSSVSSYNPMKENVHKTFGSSLSLQSSTARSLTKDIPNVHKTFGSSPSLHISTARSLTKDIPYLEGERTSLSSNAALPPLSAEVLYDSSSGEFFKPSVFLFFVNDLLVNWHFLVFITRKKEKEKANQPF